VALKHFRAISLCQSSEEAQKIPLPGLFKDPTKRALIEVLRKDIKNMGLLEYVHSILTGAIRGLNYLHSKGFSHRDIKNENILITENATAKISDFGISTQINLLANRTTSHGAFQFCPPEVLGENTYYSTSDIFSMGIVFYQLLTEGDYPFGTAPHQIMDNIREGKSDFSKLNSSNIYLGERWLEALNMIRMMTKKDHQSRPSTEELLKSIFFQSHAMKKEILIKASTILNS